FLATRCGGMDGGGRSLSPTHQTSKWQPATRMTAWAVTYRQRRQTGSMSKVILFSAQNKQEPAQGSLWYVSESDLSQEMSPCESTSGQASLLWLWLAQARSGPTWNGCPLR